MTQEKQKRQSGAALRTKDIAERCGVSQATVSRALRNDTRNHSAKTIERILAVAREMGYDPARSQEARRLVSHRHGNTVQSDMIGVFFYHEGFSQSNYCIELMQGIFDATGKSPFAVCSSDTYCVGIGDDLPPVYRRGEVDGALILDVWGAAFSVKDSLREEPGFGDRPIITLVEKVESCSSVLPDNAGAARQAIQHLLDQGHKHVLVFRSYDGVVASVHNIRWQALKETCAGQGLDPDQALVPAYWNEWYLDTSEEDLRKALHDHPELTAIIARNDFEAVHIHGALTRAGLRVPEDISLVSFDDTDAIIGKDGTNILTTVRLPLRDVGREGAKLLIRRILGEEGKDVDIALPTELIVRASTAPPRRV